MSFSLFLVVLAFVVVVGNLPKTQSQQLVCEDFEVKPQPCQAFFVGNWSQVMTIPSYGVSQEVLHAQMLQQVSGLDEPDGSFVSYLDAMTPLTYDCAVAYARAICVTFFNPCFTDGDGNQFPVPVCRSVCEDYLEACKDQNPTDFCDQVSTLTGQPIFATTGCTDNALIEMPVVYPCPPGPLKFVPHGEDPLTGASCALECTTRLYLGTTKSQFDDLFVAISVGAWVSLVSSLLLIILFSSFKAFRKWPSRLIIYSSFGILLVSIGLAGNSTQDPEDFMCESDGIHLQDQGWCRLSGFFLVFGGMTTASWWWIQVAVMLWHIGLQRKEPLNKYEPFMHLYVWGFNIIVVCILLFVPDGHSIGAFGIGPWCYRTLSASDGIWWGLFWGPFIVYSLISLVSITVTVFTIVKIGLNSTLAASQMGKFTGIIMGFGIWYLNALISVIISAGYAHWYQQSKGSSGITQFYECVFTTQGNPDDCAALVPQYSMGVLTWAIISLSFTGLAYFLLFAVFRPSTRETVRSSLAKRTSSGSKKSSSKRSTSKESEQASV